MTEQNPFDPPKAPEAEPPAQQFGSPTPAPSYPPASIASPYGTPPRPVGVAQQEQPAPTQPSHPAHSAGSAPSYAPTSSAQGFGSTSPSPTYGSADSQPGGLSPLPGTGIPIPEPTPREPRSPAAFYLVLLWILGAVVTVLGLVFVLVGLAQLADGSGAGRSVLLGQPLLTAGPIMLAIALAIQAYTAIAKRR